jgi:ferredoxin-NADP reductase
MCSTVEQLPTMRFLIRLLADGAMSTYLERDCAIDDELEIEGPHGAFKLQQPEGPVVLIAGGTGLAPILSILDTLAEIRWRAHPIYLHFGVNRLEELFYLDELAARLEWMPNLNLRVTLMEPHSDWQGALGYATDGVPEEALGPDTEAFLCGPPPMVDAAVALLKARGISPAQIHFESFIPAQESE